MIQVRLDKIRDYQLISMEIEEMSQLMALSFFIVQNSAGYLLVRVTPTQLIIDRMSGLAVLRYTYEGEAQEMINLIRTALYLFAIRVGSNVARQMYEKDNRTAFPLEQLADFNPGSAPCGPLDTAMLYAFGQATQDNLAMVARSRKIRHENLATVLLIAAESRLTLRQIATVLNLR